MIKKYCDVCGAEVLAPWDYDLIINQENTPGKEAVIKSSINLCTRCDKVFKKSLSGMATRLYNEFIAMIKRVSPMTSGEENNESIVPETPEA